MRLLALLLLLGCGADHSVRIRASEALKARARSVEVALVANCLSQSLLGPVTGDPYLRFAFGEAAPSLGDVESGDYGLFARFVDESCNVVASGCADVAVSGRGSNTYSVDLEAVSGTACGATEECVAGECVERGVGPLLDAGPDAVVEDAPLPADGGADVSIMDAPVDIADAAADVPSPCPGTGVLFCNDFEAGTLMPFTTIVGDGSSVTFTDEQAFSGSMALRMDAPPGTTQASITVREDDPPAMGQRWVRARFFIPSSPAFVGEIIDRTATDNSVSTRADEDGLVTVATFAFPGEGARDTSTIILARDRWACLESLIDYDEPSRASLFIDGAAAASFDVMFPNVFPRVQVGITYRNPGDQEDYFLYVDDVAIGSERIGCD